MSKRSPTPPLQPQHPRKQRLLDPVPGLNTAEEKAPVEEKPAVPASPVEEATPNTSPKIQRMPEVPLVVQYVGDNFYVRDCFEAYFRILTKLLAEYKRCVTITGTPGTGKSVFYAYCYDRFRAESTDMWIVAAAFENFSFRRGILSKDGMKTTLYKFSRYEELEEAADEAKKKLLYLCDGPPHTTQHQMIVFTSPNEGWQKISRKHVCDYYMPLWTCEELQEAAALLDLRIEDDVIVERFNKFGGVARECLCLEAGKLEVIECEILEEIQKFSSPEEVRNILLEIGNAKMCHRLLHFQPDQQNKQLKTTLLASPFLSQQLEKKMLQLLRNEREKYESTIRGIAEDATLR